MRMDGLLLKSKSTKENNWINENKCYNKSWCFGADLTLCLGGNQEHDVAQYDILPVSRRKSHLHADNALERNLHEAT